MTQPASLSESNSPLNPQDQLASQIHSTSETESYHALSALSQDTSNDSGRALIDAYLDCQWRDTKRSIIQALGRNGSERAVNFLLTLARSSDDIGLVQEVVLALGESKDSVAATYLLENLKPAPPYMKPWIISALTRVPDFRAIGEIRRILADSKTAEHPLLYRNCIVALSEMKDVGLLGEMIAKLRERLQSHKGQVDETSMTLLGAIARLSRSPADITEFEAFFGREMLHEQFYKQCMTHIDFRKQWTLEDYLGKIFFAESFHPLLPLELNSFDLSDVAEALSLFSSDPKHFNSLCTVLKFYSGAGELLDTTIRCEALDEENLCRLLESITFNRSTATKTLCEGIFENKIKNSLNLAQTSKIFSAWLKTILCIDPDPLSTVFRLLDEQLTDRSWHEQNRIELINAFVNASLALHHERSWSKKHISTISQCIEQEESDTVLGRWIRALGESGLTVLKLSQATLERCKNSDTLCASALLMLSRLSGHNYPQLLKQLEPEAQKKSNFRAAYLRACATLKTPDKALPNDDLVESSLNANDPEQIVAALHFLSRQPRSRFLPDVNSLCQPDPADVQISIHAIVAARSYQSESSVHALTGCLGSSSKIIAGRALDSLLAIDANAARGAVIEFLTAHESDSFIVDKVLRSLKLPEKGDEVTAQLLEKHIATMPHSPLRDELSQLESSLKHGVHVTSNATPSSGVIQQLDEQLSLKIVDFAKLPDPIKASLRSAEIPHKQPELFEGSVDKSASVVQYCKALDLTLEKEFGQKFLFPKLEQQLHIFQNILRKVELDQDTVNTAFVMRQLGIEHLFEPQTFPALKMKMLARSILTGKILRERTQVIDGLKAWAVLLLLFSGHDVLWGQALSPTARIKLQTLAQKLVHLQDLRNPAAHRQTMLTLAPLSEIRKDVFDVFSIIKTIF